MSPPETASATDRPRDWLVQIAQWAAYLAAWAVVLPAEISRWTALPPALRGPAGWLLHLNIDTSLYLLLLAVAPFAWRARPQPFRRRSLWDQLNRWMTSGADEASLKRVAGDGPEGSPGESLSIAQSHPRSVANGRGSRWHAVLLALSVGMVSLAISAGVGARFGDSPPAFHDEYSYLIQAETFLAGRTSYPSHAAPRLFDQMHVLNEGRFVSRYFPGTGLWMVPFVAGGHPYWGHWLAGAISAMLIFFIGRELAGDFAGWLAGMLTATSPGMALFSNLLLAHHPTVVGLSLFILGYLRMLRLQSFVWAAVAGCGLSFAMLCRPMTAAGVALPFGIHLLAWAMMGWGAGVIPQHRRWGLTCALGIPVCAGMLALFFYDQAVTGSGWLTPYSQYTDIYTPRHVYGFNNVVRGERKLGPRVLQNYDQWAENLTPALAAENVEHRWIASWQWTLGVVPLAMSLVAGLVLWRRQSVGTQLVLASILSLHVAHIPYWFDGIMHWHYVFESGPLWLLWFAVISVQMLSAWRKENRPRMPLWWFGLLLVPGLMNYTSCEDHWDARLAQGMGEIEYPRRKYAQFEQALTHEVTVRPALLLIESDPNDRHMDYIVNRPALQADVLRARYLPDAEPLNRLTELFPDRAIYLYRASERRFIRLR